MGLNYYNRMEVNSCKEIISLMKAGRRNQAFIYIYIDHYQLL
jgi:hypothetical protein